MDSILEFEFLQNAIIGAILISIITGFIGSLISTNKMMFLSGAVAHCAYGGIGIALFFGIPIMLGTSLFSILAATILALVSLKIKDKTDTIIGVIWAFGMAVGIILIDLTPGYNTDLMSYLFGSILSISKEDIIFASILDISIIAFSLIFYKMIIAISFDKEFAKIRGLRVELFYIILMILIALSIVVSIRVAGLILIIALFSIPSFIAQFYSNSLLKMMIVSSLLSAIFIFSGLFISYYFDITSGAAIIVVASAIFFSFLGFVKNKI